MAYWREGATKQTRLRTYLYLVLLCCHEVKRCLSSAEWVRVPIMIGYSQEVGSNPCFQPLRCLGNTQRVSCVRPGLCRSRDCNRRGDHSWARMAPASRRRTRRKSPCAFRVEHALHVHPCRQTRCGGTHGRMGNDQAGSPGLFAGRTLVHQQ